MSLRIKKNTVQGLLSDTLPDYQTRELLKAHMGLETLLHLPDPATILAECLMPLNIRPPSCPYQAQFLLLCFSSYYYNLTFEREALLSTSPKLLKSQHAFQYRTHRMSTPQGSPCKYFNLSSCLSGSPSVSRFKCFKCPKKFKIL